MDKFKINLQLFADEEGDEIPIEPEDKNKIEEEIEIEVDDYEKELRDEEGQEDRSEEEQQEVLENKLEEDNRTVPLKALEAERKKWQEKLKAAESKIKLADKLKEATGKDYDAIMQELDQIEVKKHVDSGMTPEVAQAFVLQQRENQEIRKMLNKQKYDAEVLEMKSNSYYADIDSVREEVEDLSSRTGLNLKQAYNALYGDIKATDYERSVEQRVLNNLAKKQSKKLDTTSNGTVNVQPKKKLSANEIEIAEMAGMTPQEYYLFKTGSNIEQFKKK